MPAEAVLAPAALLAVAALAAAAGAHRPDGVGRGLVRAGVAGAWLAPPLVVGLWAGAGATPIELTRDLPTLAGIPLGFRMDATAATLELLALVPLPFLVAWTRSSPGAVSGLLGGAAIAVLAILADRLLLAAFLIAATASVLAAVLMAERSGSSGAEAGEERSAWPALYGGSLLLAAGSVAVEAAGGTSVYSATPVTALQGPAFAVLAAGSAALAGLVPWRGWPVALGRAGPVTGPASAAALVLPLGFLVLIRAYGLGAGRWPSHQLAAALALLAVAVAVAAGLRAQSADSRRGHLAELLALSSGLALLALAAGTALGVAAALAALLEAGVLIVLVVAIPTARGPWVVLGLAAAAGLPPVAAFAGRLLALQSAFDAGGYMAVLGILAVAAWLLALAASARAVTLRRGAEAGAGAPIAAAVALAAIAGIGMGVFEWGLGLPAAAEQIKLPASLVPGTQPEFGLPAGGWDPLLTGIPLLLLAAAGLALAWRFGPAAGPVAAGAPPAAPPLSLAGSHRAAAVAARVRGLRLPEQYRSLLDAAGAARSLTRTRPWLWVIVTVALAVLVAR